MLDRLYPFKPIRMAKTNGQAGSLIVNLPYSVSHDLFILTDKQALTSRYGQNLYILCAMKNSRVGTYGKVSLAFRFLGLLPAV